MNSQQLWPPAYDETCQQSSTGQEAVSLAEDLLTVERESVFFKHVAPSRSATIQWTVVWEAQIVLGL